MSLLTSVPRRTKYFPKLFPKRTTLFFSPLLQTNCIKPALLRAFTKGSAFAHGKSNSALLGDSSPQVANEDNPSERRQHYWAIPAQGNSRNSQGKKATRN